MKNNHKPMCLLSLKIWVQVPIFLLVLIFSLSLCLYTVVFAKNVGEKILILNSNLSAPNYSLAQKSFISNLKGNPQVVDLGKKDMDRRKIKKVIRNRNSDLIYAIGSKAYLLAEKYAGDGKIVFSSAINWQRLPKNKLFYGISNELPPGMQLTMYRYFFPNLKKIGVIYSKKYNKQWMKLAVSDGKDLGIEIIGIAIRDSDDLREALQGLLPQVDALWLTSDPVVISSKDSVFEIFKKTAADKKPVFAYSKIFAKLGAMLVISADVPTIGMQAAELAKDILANNQVSDKVINPAGSHITINIKKVKEYGVNFNDQAMDSVNTIIK